MNIELSILLNDIIEKSFNKDYINKRIKENDVSFLMKNNNLNFDSLVSLAKDKNLKNLIRENYIFSLS